jgi:hypothetical protein
MPLVTCPSQNEEGWEKTREKNEPTARPMSPWTDGDLRLHAAARELHDFETDKKTGLSMVSSQSMKGSPSVFSNHRRHRAEGRGVVGDRGGRLGLPPSLYFAFASDGLMRRTIL